MESLTTNQSMKTGTKKKRGCRCICWALVFLVLDIFLLVFFSIGLVLNWQTRAVYTAGTPSCVIFLVLLFYCLGSACRIKTKEDVRAAVDKVQVDLEADSEFLKTLTGLPTRFSFKALESATENFSKKLGRGGFGSVYEGTLPDGSKVAVKRLEREGHGQKEFCTEVATISRVRHLNLVCLKGFCVEGSERLLVYEFMPRGSLDAWIFHDRVSSSPLSSAVVVVLSWETRYNIALETARGLAYLHEECEERILHLDVKPQNILLDEKFHAKVSDFGLARSMNRGQSRVVTTMRGTPGYLAPEWLREEGIDSKTDVYSYGMLVLELVGGRRSEDHSQGNLENWYLPTMAFKKMKEDRVLDVVDPLLNGKLDEKACKQALLIVSLALWCIQDDVATRPKMSSVVQMLEGTVTVQKPPDPSRFMSTRDLSIVSITFADEEILTIQR